MLSAWLACMGMHMARPDSKRTLPSAAALGRCRHSRCSASPACMARLPTCVQAWGGERRKGRRGEGRLLEDKRGSRGWGELRRVVSGGRAIRYGTGRSDCQAPPVQAGWRPGPQRGPPFRSPHI